MFATTDQFEETRKTIRAILIDEGYEDLKYIEAEIDRQIQLIKDLYANT